MDVDSPIISRGTLQRGQLRGMTALVTGAGGGIGYETARALAWLGARVVIAEIDKKKGILAERQITNEFGSKVACFFETDIGSERSVDRLYRKALGTFGSPDVIINNATVTPIGPVHTVGLEQWDASYQTNLRGPVLLLRRFLPDMLARDAGIIIMVPSSGAAPYMGAYEVFKTAQVELGNTLAAELENTHIIAFSIGPGYVPTQTARESVKHIAQLQGSSLEEIEQVTQPMRLTAEEAGAGFAAAVALADRYRGLEIGSIQALMDCGILVGDAGSEGQSASSLDTPGGRDILVDLFESIMNTLSQQVKGWKQRSVFERQWVIRDFKKQTGKTPEQFLSTFSTFQQRLSVDAIRLNDVEALSLDELTAYYQHQIKMLKDYEKNPEKVEEYTQAIREWVEVIERFIHAVRNT